MFSQRSFWEFGSRGVNRCNGLVIPDVSENSSTCLHLQGLSWTTHPILIRHSRPTAYSGATCYQKWPWTGCAYFLLFYIKLSETGSISTQNKSCKNFHGDINHEISPEYLWLGFKSVLFLRGASEISIFSRSFLMFNSDGSTYRAMARNFERSCGMWRRLTAEANFFLHPNTQSTNKSTNLLGNQSQSTSGGRMFCKMLYIINVKSDYTF